MGGDQGQGCPPNEAHLLDLHDLLLLAMQVTLMLLELALQSLLVALQMTNACIFVEQEACCTCHWFSGSKWLLPSAL